MRVIRTVAELRDALGPSRRAGRTIGFVPTMGAFHDGHLSLMRRARELADVVVVSLFVNPTQFRPGEDLSAYPRDEARDTELAEGAGVDVLFVPNVEEVYPPGFSTTVQVGDLTAPLEGFSRGPEHFHGVTTVVTKLFNMVQPDIAVFGQKDAQQALVIRRMARDLNMPVRIEVAPTVREPDGLAMSSRNAYLDDDSRARAVALSRGLRAAEEATAAGERDPAVLVAVARGPLEQAGIEPEYVELVSTEDLRPVDRLDGEALLAVAARVGPARLIDNVILRGHDGNPEPDTGAP
jgi:pantoate--beta-alanine ligase